MTKTARIKANNPVSQEVAGTPTNGDIASRAYELYLARDCQHGHDIDDWLQAERDVLGAVGVGPK